jgi:hypothetical protein
MFYVVLPPAELAGSSYMYHIEIWDLKVSYILFAAEIFVLHKIALYSIESTGIPRCSALHLALFHYSALAKIHGSAVLCC